jgi:hypothetical protein
MAMVNGRMENAKYLRLKKRVLMKIIYVIIQDQESHMKRYAIMLQ